MSIAAYDGAATLHLTPEQLEAFGAELEALRARVMGELGERDARYLHDLIAWQRRAELAGRGLLFASPFPPAFVLGVSLLSLSKILETMEIGHNVLHGQYDWMNEPDLQGASYEWDLACPAEHWRHMHNYVHHTFTNIVGKDRDVGYGVLRMADEQPWHPLNLPQPIYALSQIFAFDWAVALHRLELNLVLTGEKPPRALLDEGKLIVRKARQQVLKEYVCFPLLAGPAAPLVFVGNLSANVVRNVWAFLVIFCGHFPDGVKMYLPEETEGETRAGWYLRQIRSSANIEGPRWFHVLSGHLGHQIEHHLFPDMPAPRYAEIAPEVQALCRKYGVPYNTASFGRQLAGAVRRIFRGALPPRRSRPTAKGIRLAS